MFGISGKDIAKPVSLLRSIFRNPAVSELEPRREAFQAGDRHEKSDDEERRLLQLLLLYH